MKTRIFKENNYKAVFSNGKTLRLALNPDIPIGELDYPEFYDVKITSFCEGKCPYCYQDSLPNKTHVEDALTQIENFFGHMTENERPFQVALGGGNPNQHPDFVKILEMFDSLGIVPNYTTNGMGLTEEVMDATKKYCGGVAISCHPHLEAWWQQAVGKMRMRGIKTNLHIIISDSESVDKFMCIYEKYHSYVDYFVLLPYESAGRAKKKEVDYDYLMKRIITLPDLNQIAFGANFYPHLQKDDHNVAISLYEPEILSKYLDLADMSLYRSSFNLSKVKLPDLI